VLLPPQGDEAHVVEQVDVVAGVLVGRSATLCAAQSTLLLLRKVRLAVAIVLLWKSRAKKVRIGRRGFSRGAADFPVQIHFRKARRESFPAMCDTSAAVRKQTVGTLQHRHNGLYPLIGLRV